ncbi:class I SAM-dependent methyltransferase [Actinomadura sp. NEAU-AAG7]|uniref:methyltransferase n=1 Tax=Actinomadura sp. NEAU-AAG7 TaxID=2839640 RepID=UPI001BE4A609|nr:class I SAM-dependent methyltransferase [Actinomadura sp. NEAU-AAG7]MBT2206943.1 class I SAM-dependent methyltransferase [Actinomadura sp. NEAU-AAG7]
MDDVNEGPTRTEEAVIGWRDADGAERRVRWRSESGAPPPRRVVVADDETRAADAYRLACEGTALLWRGDFQNARQLLSALARRIDRPPRRQRRKGAEPSQVQAFHLYRQARAQRARTLGMLLIPFDPGHVVPLRRAPDVVQACTEAYGPCDEPYVTSLRELLGLIGAHEWRRKGVPIPALDGDRIHPHYGVFSPVRGEYVDLVARAPLPGTALAFDIGTGTGVLAAVLGRRGIRKVIATDQDPRALACAQENLDRLDVSDRVEAVQADLFPDGRAGLIVCNPPWVPAKPTSPLEHAVYDPDSRMLRGFLRGLADHLEPGGEGWLILSDLAEHLGLRTRDELLGMIGTSGLEVAGRLDAAPAHPRAADPDDPLHAARSAEVTSLWRLRGRA